MRRQRAEGQDAAAGASQACNLQATFYMHLNRWFNGMGAGGGARDGGMGAAAMGLGGRYAGVQPPSYAMVQPAAAAGRDSSIAASRRRSAMLEALHTLSSATAAASASASRD